MSIRKQGIQVACEKCELIRGDGQGGFEITVPMKVEGTAIDGYARLHWAVVDGCHQIQLLEWQGGDHQPLAIADDQRRRIAEALDAIAEQRVCGNTKICPLEVVRIVEGRAG